MSDKAQLHRYLLLLMEQALDVCTALRDYSNENFEVFCSDNDELIIEVINKREKMIETLITIENKTDQIFEVMEEFDNGASLSEDIEAVRQKVKNILSDVSTKDIEIMKNISSRMQLYKNETLKARNKKKLSAYMKTTFVDELGESINFSK